MIFVLSRLLAVSLLLTPVLYWGYPFWVAHQSSRALSIVVLALAGSVLSVVGGVLQNALKDDVKKLGEIANKLGNPRAERIKSATQLADNHSVYLQSLNAAAALISLGMVSPPSVFEERVVVGLTTFASLLGVTSWIDAVYGRRRTAATITAYEELVRIEIEHRQAIKDLRKDKALKIEVPRAVVGIYDYRSRAEERLSPLDADDTESDE